MTGVVTRPVEPLLEYEPGLGQIIQGIDALDFGLVIDLIALHPQAGAQKLIDATTYV